VYRQQDCLGQNPVIFAAFLTDYGELSVNTDRANETGASSQRKCSEQRKSEAEKVKK
jgi:hypothetical protein